MSIYLPGLSDKYTLKWAEVDCGVGVLVTESFSLGAYSQAEKALLDATKAKITARDLISDLFLFLILLPFIELFS